MNQASTLKTPPASLMEKIKREIEVFSAVYDIFQKTQNENNITPIIDPIKSIIQSEIYFALEKLDNVSVLTDMSDLKRQVLMNSYIFKENLKIICGIIGELIS